MPICIFGCISGWISHPLWILGKLFKKTSLTWIPINKINVSNLNKNSHQTLKIYQNQTSMKSLGLQALVRSNSLKMLRWSPRSSCLPAATDAQGTYGAGTNMPFSVTRRFIPLVLFLSVHWGFLGMLWKGGMVQWLLRCCDMNLDIATSQNKQKITIEWVNLDEWYCSQTWNKVNFILFFFFEAFIPIPLDCYGSSDRPKKLLKTNSEFSKPWNIKMRLEKRSFCFLLGENLLRCLFSVFVCTRCSF